MEEMTTPVEITKKAEHGTGYRMPTRTREWLDIEDPETPYRIFRFDVTLLLSNYTCIFGNGCKGVFKDGQGCCSHGTRIAPQELERITNAVSRLPNPPKDWRYKNRDSEGYIRTKVSNGACIFHTDTGCALHAAALDAGENPYDWKPLICSSYPLGWAAQWIHEDSVELITVTTITAHEWADEGRWWCTESHEAYGETEPMFVTWGETLIRMVGPSVYGELYKVLIKRIGDMRAGYSLGQIQRDFIPTRVGLRALTQPETDPAQIDSLSFVPPGL